MQIPITDLSNKDSFSLMQKIALVQGEKKWTYKELHEKTCEIAAHLWEDGLRPKDRLLLCLENGFDLVASLLACFKIGITVVHTYTDFSEAEFGYMSENTGAK